MKKIILVLIGVCFTSITHARLNIEITQGKVAGVPIAVSKSLQENNTSTSFEELAAVIRSDLKMCGLFAPLYPQQMPYFANIAEQQKAANWQRVGAENVVLGVVEPMQDNFRVSFKLLDIYKKNQGSLQQGELSVPAEGNVLASKIFTNIRRQDMRQLAHHISDIIYEKLTGIRGAFSTRVAYVMVIPGGNARRYSLEVADADGFNPRTLVRSNEPIMSPSWSPDGKRVAFVSFENHRAETYMVDVATGQRRLLTKFPGINGAPAFSPDGQRVAVVLSKSGAPKIYLMDILTQQLTQLTDGYSIDTEPAFSPNGQSIYYTSNRGGKPQIYRLDLASKKSSRVTFQGNYNARPMLSPDGKHLVMMHRQDKGSQFNIASLDLMTNHLNVLTHARLDESPTLSPNGAMVLYGTQEGDRQILGLVTLDGRGQLKLPAREGSVQEPAWSPFLS